jgi:kinesin family protein 2/24
MGNSESSNPIRNMDKRTARREYKEDFGRAVQRYRKQFIQRREAVGGASFKFTSDSWEDNQIRVFARKRPIFQHEIDDGEYDVVTCHQKTIIVHDCRMHTDMKRQFINHHEFQFDYAFGETSSNQNVYEFTAKPLVQIACEGGFSTAMVYGQTGSGKVSL